MWTREVSATVTGTGLEPVVARGRRSVGFTARPAPFPRRPAVPPKHTPGSRHKLRSAVAAPGNVRPLSGHFWLLVRISAAGISHGLAPW